MRLFSASVRRTFTRYSGADSPGSSVQPVLGAAAEGIRLASSEGTHSRVMHAAAVRGEVVAGDAIEVSDRCPVCVSRSATASTCTRSARARVAVAPILHLVLIVSAPRAFCQTISAAPAPSPPGLGGVLSAVPLDLWHFVSWDTALILGVGGGAALTGHIWDDDLAGELETNVSLNNAMEPG